MAIDQFSDPAFGVLVKQAAAMPAFAAYVNDAEVEGAERASLPETAFAWPEERKFPIHTAKHAALSFAYTLAQRVPAPVVARIKEALDVYGVSESTFAQAEVKVAADDDVWLLPDLKLFPVRTKDDVKVAEFRLLQEISKLDLEHRATACTNLCAKATKLGAELHPATLQFAGLVVSSTKFASEWLETRAHLVEEGAIKEGYAKLAAELRKAGPEIKDRDALIKVAAVIAELDEKAGLVKHYDRKLVDPLRTVFNTTKEAAASVDVGGKMVPLSKLASLPASFWMDLGGAELSNEIAPGGKVAVEKLAEIVPTLPLDLRVVLARQLGV